MVCWVDDDWRGYIFYSLNPPSFMPVGRPAAIRLYPTQNPPQSALQSMNNYVHIIFHAITNIIFERREGSEPPSFPNAMSFG